MSAGPYTLSAVLGLLILAILAVRAFIVMRAERDDRRGSDPGTGYHVLKSEYFSGMGGGQSREYKVPRDPQEYARLFVPKSKDTQDPKDT
ncbi:hypothetical protein SAMN04488012_10146 [Palleronia salina]|uniref:Uncharacterized protein n=1 Tax=Palleronia salina TaxID=313368 RepID=A0A1M6A9Q0_9RHOB|nr:hypothetical protein [Palleronia salina]SHI33254.1 hypothetical protein SAMN04488012_10146 [Palleronia salina]